MGFANEIGRFIRRKGSTILTVIGGIGVVATAVLAVKETPAAIDILNKLDKDADLLDKALSVAPTYAPALICGAGTIFCVFCANILDRHDMDALNTAYMLWRGYHDCYRNEVIGQYGEDAEREIERQVSRKYPDYHLLNWNAPDFKAYWTLECLYDLRNEIENPVVLDELICYEREIMDAEYHFNRNFVLRGYATLTELCEFLGIKTEKWMDQYGWDIEAGYYWIDFLHYRSEGCDGDKYVIATLYPPEFLDFER